MKRKRKAALAELTGAEWEEKSLERFRPLLSDAEYQQLVMEMQSPLVPTFRYNPLKTTREAMLKMSRRYHWTLEPISFCPMGFRVIEGVNSTSVSQTLEHKMGHYYIQEAASMLPVELFQIDDETPKLCLDLAASPGGKTTHMVARGGDYCLVFANDSSAGRIQALRIVLQNWGAVNTAITQFPGEKFGSWFPNTFDRVLIDAPCSMQGLRTAESHDVRPVTDKEISSLSRRQVNLLTRALQAVKPGGEVVYSTCTLVPDEDEAVIDAVLQRFGSKIDILQTGIPAPGILRDNDRHFNSEVAKTIRLWPNRFHTAGFFASLLRKNADLGLTSEAAPSRPLERTGFSPLLIKEVRDLQNRLFDTYQFDLATVLERYRLVLVGYGPKVFAFPERLLEDFASLPVQSAGLLVGEETIDGFVPAHEWVSRFFSDFVSNRVIVDQDHVDPWLRGENVPRIFSHTEKTGRVKIMVDPEGRFLGRGKSTDDWIKNLLPHRLV